VIQRDDKQKARKRRIIIYEDEKIIRDLFQIFFQTLEYEVVLFDEPHGCPVYNAASAGCDSLLPCADVVIADYHMPNMNGLELFQHQKDLGCKVIVKNKALISGDYDDDLQKQVAKLGATFFRKPLTLSSLANWVASCERRIDVSQPLGPIRKEKRVPFRQDILCRINSNPETLHGTSINISASGICLNLPVMIPREEKVRFITPLPFPLGMGSVRWINPHSDGYLMGLSCS